MDLLNEGCITAFKELVEWSRNNGVTKLRIGEWSADIVPKLDLPKLPAPAKGNIQDIRKALLEELKEFA